MKQTRILNKDAYLLTARAIAMAMHPSGKARLSCEKMIMGAVEYAVVDFCLKRKEGRVVQVADATVLANEKQELRLFFQGCLAPAAPFLLFRLKRQGFSRCRAEAAPEGIYLSAVR